jgi:hypothetical protein
MAIKKCGWESYMTPRRPIGSREDSLEEPPSLPTALLLVAWESYMTNSRPKYTKTPPQAGRNFYFLIEKFPKTAFLYKNL